MQIILQNFRVSLKKKFFLFMLMLMFTSYFQYQELLSYFGCHTLTTPLPDTSLKMGWISTFTAVQKFSQYYRYYFTRNSVATQKAVGGLTKIHIKHTHFLKKRQIFFLESLKLSFIVKNSNLILNKQNHAQAPLAY